MLTLRYLVFTCVSSSLLWSQQQAFGSIEPADSGISRPVMPEEPSFDWNGALNQSFRMLMIEHAFRFGAQPGTRARLSGPFFRDYAESVTALGGWGDSDPWIINYLGHPIQGGAAAYVQIQNDRRGKRLRFGDDGYWNSRLKALAWNAAYSFQWELGPFSESSLGNVGQRKGTQGYVDLVMTPAGGFAFNIAEDAVDRWLERFENGKGRGSVRFYRIAMNPCRSVANLMRGKWPWYRDTRP